MTNIILAVVVLGVNEDNAFNFSVSTVEFANANSIKTIKPIAKSK